MELRYLAPDVVTTQTEEQRIEELSAQSEREAVLGFGAMSDEELRTRLSSSPILWSEQELLESTVRFGYGHAIVAAVFELRSMRLRVEALLAHLQ